MKLCINCLEEMPTTTRPVPVGPEIGPQMDPRRETLDLCDPCRDALVTGKMEVLHERYSAERRITRG